MTLPCPQPEERTHLIAVGSNLGDRHARLLRARAVLSARLGAEVVMSRVYRTAPMYVEEQPEFLNAMFRVRSALEPEAMLQLLLTLEQEAGRDRNASARYGARPLDLDLIAVDDLIVRTEALTLPHPRLQERGFVLVPLCDLAPDWVHPILHRSAAELLEALRIAGQIGRVEVISPALAPEQHV